MQCEQCGARLGFGADACAECGAPVKRPAGAAAPDLDLTAVDAPLPKGIDARPSDRRIGWVLPVVVAVVLIAIAAGGFFLIKGLSGANGPDAAAVRMMNGFANYDADAILDNVTHASLTATDVAMFAQQTADHKRDNNGLVAVKEISVVKVTQDPKTPNVATVQLSARWLTDPAKKTYTTRTETLTLVKQSGKWLVKLFP